MQNEIVYNSILSVFLVSWSHENGKKLSKLASLGVILSFLNYSDAPKSKGERSTEKLSLQNVYSLEKLSPPNWFKSQRTNFNMCTFFPSTSFTIIFLLHKGHW